MKEEMDKIGQDISLRDKAYETIKQKIIRGLFNPGKQLPEKDLVNILNISPILVREALSKLERDGFVKIIPDKGAVVSRITRQVVIDTFEIRENLEVLALQKSICKIDEKDIDSLLQEFEEFNNHHSAINNTIHYITLDTRLHNLIIEKCGNKQLINYLAVLQQKSYWYRGVIFSDFAVHEMIHEDLGFLML